MVQLHMPHPAVLHLKKQKDEHAVKECDSNDEPIERVVHLLGRQEMDGKIHNSIE